MPLIVQGTEYVMLPKGLTGERPVTPLPGMVRINTTTKKFEVYINSQWNEFGSIV
jgi:hypothetical protein